MDKAADLVINGFERTIAKRLLHDFARLMTGAKEVSCSGIRRKLLRI